MNENNTPQQTDSMLDAGFETEAEQATDSTQAGPATKKGGKSFTELKANFASVFGHGVGKIALIGAGTVVVVGTALGIRGLTADKELPADSTQVDVPNAPRPKVSVDPIDQREAERRAERAALEAEAARKKGQTYQPDFNPTVVEDRKRVEGGSAQPHLNFANSGQPTQPAGAPSPVEVAVPAGRSSTAHGQHDRQTDADARQERQRQLAEIKKQQDEADDFVDEVRKGVMKQTEDLLGSPRGSAVRGGGTYTITSYMPIQQNAPAGAPNGTQQGLQPANQPGAGSNAPKGPPIFKAGYTIFATLDAEVNTDDGGEVFATVRGGSYDGAKLIGKIEQAPRNIRLRFTTLAPQAPDNRPTMTINAIAIREQDAKQGVAETIDHHTIERYSALFFGSVLSGLGKAAAHPTGDVVILPNGQTVVQQDELSNKRIAMYALGEVGTNAGAEVRKNFAQPPTYITPANKGIGVIFLTDVNEKQ